MSETAQRSAAAQEPSRDRDREGANGDRDRERRSDRSDRSDRERGDRDRERGDRERGERDRGDRDRERERDRRERDRDYRGGGGGRHRSSSRDRHDRDRGGDRGGDRYRGGGDRYGEDRRGGDRYGYDRDYERYDRERFDRDRERDRGYGGTDERRGDDRPRAFDPDAVARSLAGGPAPAPPNAAAAPAASPTVAGAGAVHPSRLGLVGSVPSSAAHHQSHTAPAPAHGYSHVGAGSYSSLNTPSVSAYGGGGGGGALATNPGLNNQLVQATRNSRRLFIGNLPAHPNLSDRVVQQFIEAFMQQRGFTTPAPIVSVSLSPERAYCFAELRSVADAVALVLLLDGQDMGPKKLRVSRPRDYAPPPPGLDAFIVGHPPGAFQPPVKTEQEATALNARLLAFNNTAAAVAQMPGPTLARLLESFQPAGLPAAATAAAPIPPFDPRAARTNVVALAHLVSAADSAAADAAGRPAEDPLRGTAAWLDLVDDLRSECAAALAVASEPGSLLAVALASAGPVANAVLRVIVPRLAPLSKSDLAAEPPASVGTGGEGVRVGVDQGPVAPDRAGSAWIEFTAPVHAEAVIAYIHGRIYRRNKVVASFGASEEVAQLVELAKEQQQKQDDA
jgi:hypothetical protein